MSADERPSELQRILRVRDGLAVAVGIVIGAGILRTPGLIAGYLGNATAIIGVWFLGGMVVALSTLVLAEMAAALPEAGGKYVYAREAYGPLVGFVAGWSELLVARAFSGAAKAVVIAEYLVLLLGRGSVPLLASLVILFSSLNVNFLGMPRVVFGLARNGLAPSRFTRVGEGGTPGPALAFVTVLILGLAVSGTFEFLIRFMMTVAITVDLVVLSGIFRLRRLRPQLARPFKVPMYPWLPAATLVLHFLVLAIVVRTQPVLKVLPVARQRILPPRLSKELSTEQI